VALIEPGGTHSEAAEGGQVVRGTCDNRTHDSLRSLCVPPVVLYFYPRDNTSGCTKEACAFRDRLPKFRRSKAVVFGVSPDTVESHAKFAERYDLNFTLLADVPETKGDTPKVCAAYGVWQPKTMGGRKYMGVVRTTYLINIEGTVARRWDKVKVDGHADEVLAAVKAL
jgi:peroxiredoxin Q/BCP